METLRFMDHILLPLKSWSFLRNPQKLEIGLFCRKVFLKRLHCPSVILYWAFVLTFLAEFGVGEAEIAPSGLGVASAVGGKGLVASGCDGAAAECDG